MKNAHNSNPTRPSHAEELAIVKSEDYDAEIRRGNISSEKPASEKPKDSVEKHRL